MSVCVRVSVCGATAPWASLDPPGRHTRAPSPTVTVTVTGRDVPADEEPVATADHPEDADQRRSRRRARGAVAAVFFTNGALFADVLPRYPEIRPTWG